jgi:tetratricopeptide (TPR) repeat protein
LVKKDAPRVHSRLVIFISSTGDLEKAREVVEQTLPELEIGGSRFESWPASPNPPIAECLRHVEESDGLILLLDSGYGTINKDSGLSITHLEYRRAKDLKKPIFAYILESPEREEAQARFIEEVKNDLFIRFETPIGALGKEVKDSLIQEFTRCFRQVHAYPPASPPSQIFHGTTVFQLPFDPKEAFGKLSELYKSNDDMAIHQVAADCETRFSQNPEIMNIIYMAEVNYGMDGGYADKDRLQRALEFWDDFEAQRRWVRFSLDYNQGNALGVLGRHQEAIEKFRQALKEMPEHAQSWKNLGNAYLDIGNKTAALQCFEEALRLNPLLFEALYSLATLKRQENDPQGALAYLNRIITSNLTPDQLSWVQGWKAVTYMEQGLFPDGIAKVEEALAHRPDWEWAWSLAGRLYSLVRHEDTIWLVPAEAFWRRFLDKYPEKAEAWAELGFIYWFLRKQGNVERYSILALKAFTKAVNLGFQDDGLILDRIGHLYQNKDNWTEAENWYRQAAQKNPGAFGYCFGVSLIFLGRHEEALPWVREAAEKHQPDAKSWFQVAVCLEKLGRIDESAVAYQKAISLDSDYPEAWFNLGGLHWNVGNHEQALAVWSEAKARFPEHPLGRQVDKLLD